MRAADGWDLVEADLPEDVIELPKIGCRLRVAEVYDETGVV